MKRKHVVQPAVLSFIFMILGLRARLVSFGIGRCATRSRFVAAVCLLIHPFPAFAEMTGVTIADIHSGADL